MAQDLKIGGGGTVLIVDDDQILRDLIKVLLMGLGFSVLEAKDGLEAMEVFSQNQDTIRCVLCDLIMPNMNGWETVAALQQLAPTIPVILSSAYDPQALVLDGSHSEVNQIFLGKPYGVDQLRQAIGKALNADFLVNMKELDISDILANIREKAHTICSKIVLCEAIEMDENEIRFFLACNHVSNCKVQDAYLRFVREYDAMIAREKPLTKQINSINL